MRHSVALILAVWLQCSQPPALAQWSHDPSGNNPLCTATGDQSYPAMVGDGEGGAIVTWTDGRGPDNDIYAQRISATGIVEGSPNGIPVCIARNDQTAPTIVTDGAGGAIISWTDNRSGDNDIYAQRVSASGTILWTPGGVPLCAAPNDQVASTIISDGAGGAIAAWRDLRSGSSYDVFAQRIGPSGAVKWMSNGVPICTAANRQTDPSLATDDAGGAIVAWLDNRTGRTDIYAQHVTAAGVPTWSTNGIIVTKIGSVQRTPAIISDGTGGAIVTWRDARSKSGYEIHSQRVNANGSIQWSAEGVPVCTAAGERESPVIVRDGLHGGIIAWADHRNGSADIYAQHIDFSGLVGWSADGIPVCKAPGNQAYPEVAADGLGGAIVTWLDYRRGEGDIYAQRVNALGAAQWTPDGTAVCNSPGEQLYPGIVAGGVRGVIIAWFDYRSGRNSDIFAQLVDRVGYLGDASPGIAGIGSIANESGRKITLMWNHSYIDAWPNQTVSSYALWRGVKPTPLQRVASLPEKARTKGAENRGDGPSVGAPLTGQTSQTAQRNSLGTSTMGVAAEDTIFWEYVTAVRPHWVKGYSYTFSVSSEPGEEIHDYFMVTALTADPLVYWDSEIESDIRGTGLPAPASQLSSLRFSFPPLFKQ